MKRSSLPRRFRPLRKTGLKPKQNWKGVLKRKRRTRKEFARIYGSKARVEFVKSLPCAACGIVGASENAHVLGNGGLSRKGAYRGIAPLCGHWTQITPLSIISRLGCHLMYDEYRESFNRRFPDFDPEEAAQATERRWLSVAGGDNTQGESER